MRRADIMGGSLFLAFALAMMLLVIPSEEGGGVWHGLSPYFYPMVMLVGIAVCSVGLVVQAWRKPELYRDEPNPVSLVQLGFFSLSWLIVLAGVAVTAHLGIWIGGPFLIAAMMLFMGERNPLRIVPTAIAPVALVHLLATYLIRTPLP